MSAGLKVALMRGATELLKIRALQSLPIALGWGVKHPIPREVADGYLAPSRHSAAIRDDVRRFLVTARKRHTLEAARGFPRLTG